MSMNSAAALTSHVPCHVTSAFLPAGVIDRTWMHLSHHSEFILHNQSYMMQDCYCYIYVLLFTIAIVNGFWQTLNKYGINVHLYIDIGAWDCSKLNLSYTELNIVVDLEFFYHVVPHTVYILWPLYDVHD